MYTSQRVEGLTPLTCGDNSKEGALDSSQAVLFPTPAVTPALGSLHASSHFTFLSYANLPPSCYEPDLNLGPVTRLDPIVLQGQLHGQDLRKTSESIYGRLGGFQGPARWLIRMSGDNRVLPVGLFSGTEGSREKSRNSAVPSFYLIKVYEKKFNQHSVIDIKMKKRILSI